MADFKRMQEAVIEGDEQRVEALVRTELNSGTDPRTILNHGLIPAMDVVGEQMETGEMFIPEVLMAARSMAAGVAILKPMMEEDKASSRGRVLIGTVKGDLHDIGKNLVAMLIESSGLEVDNIGIDIAPETFVTQAREKKSKIVCLSALLTTTMPMMKKTVDAFVESGLRDQVKILVGGAPVTQKFAEEIGADGYAPDAGAAAKIVKKLITA